MARRDVPGTPSVHFYFSDHLGSASVVTNASGTMSLCPAGNSPMNYTTIATGEEESDYYPYGGEMKLCDRSPQNYKFTGKERDTESGLDNFGARYDSSSLGRFMTPDWAARPTTVPYAVFGDPQSLNLYGYVRNDPISNVDVDGHISLEALCPSEKGCSTIAMNNPNPRPPGTRSAPNTNQQTREDIAKRAEKYKGSTDWAYDKKKGAFGCNTWKCNQFVGDVVKEAGASAEVNGRYPTAGEWADKKTRIANWRVLGTDETPQAGDVAAYKIPGCHDCTGHSGIVIGVDSQGVHAMAAHYDVVGPEEKFQPTNSAVVYRRYTGD